MNITNSILIIGNLGADPELRQTTAGTAVARFSVATTERYKNRAGDKVQETQWHTCIAWQKLAEIVAEYAKKGDKVAVRGAMQYRSYEDKEGNTRNVAEIKVQDFQILSSKQDRTQPAPAEKTEKAKSPTDNQKEGDDDLPF